MRRPPTQGSSSRASGSLEAAQRPVRSAQGRHGYVGAGASLRAAQHSVRSEPAQYVSASGANVSHPSLRSAQRSRADEFVAAGLAMPRNDQVRFCSAPNESVYRFAL
jgi:hypothetical protein